MPAHAERPAPRIPHGIYELKTRKTKDGKTLDASATALSDASERDKDLVRAHTLYEFADGQLGFRAITVRSSAPGFGYTCDAAVRIDVSWSGDRLTIPANVTSAGRVIRISRGRETAVGANGKLTKGVRTRTENNACEVSLHSGVRRVTMNGDQVLMEEPSSGETLLLVPIEKGPDDTALIPPSDTPLPPATH